MSSNLYINNNLPAYIKLTMLTNHIMPNQLIKELCIESTFFSHLMSGYCDYKKIDDLFRIVQFLENDTDNVLKRNIKFEKIRNNFYNSFFYCLDSRKDLYMEIQTYFDEINNTPYYIDYLIIDFVYNVSIGKDTDIMKDKLESILPIYTSLSVYYKQMFCIYKLYFLKNLSMYQNALLVLQELHLFEKFDNHLEGRLYYTGMSIYRALGNIDKARKYYELAKKSFSKMQNHAMLENLNIKYSILLRSVGELKEALKNDVKLLEEYTIKHYRLRNIEILYNNIAWNYSLLHDYRKAVLYYKKALETLQDNDVLFNMAYCCYKVDEISQALHYLKLGRFASNCGEYIYRLIEWLEYMIKDKYGSRTLSILLSILSDYPNDIEKIDRDTIQIEIINYYYYNGMYEEAINALQPLMGKKLISPSELIFAKDKGKTEYDTLSFDDMDDKTIVKDDDLFFDDERINDDDWEELDDSFSSFAFN